jgi:hypothetical protein
MLSLVEVKCPHCGAHGQIMLPPLGAIIIGPCPECEGMVVVFCGKVLPLDKEIMLNGSALDKQEHLLEVLGVFLHDRIQRLFAREAHDGLLADTLQDKEEGALEEGTRLSLVRQIPATPITKEEMDSFLSVELKLIDDRDYFRAIFE